MNGRIGELESTLKMELQHIVHRVVISFVEPLEWSGQYFGNGQHAAQNIGREVLRILFDQPKKKILNDTILCKNSWRTVEKFLFGNAIYNAIRCATNAYINDFASNRLAEVITEEIALQISRETALKDAAKNFAMALETVVAVT